MISVEDLTFSYPGKRVLNGVTFSLGENRILSLLGRNGAGKTTLLKCLNRLLDPDFGKVRLCGRDASGLSSLELARLVGYVPQVAREEPMTVFDAVLLGRKPYMGFRSSDEDLHMVEEMLHFMDLERHAFKFTSELSGGEYQKVIIARALVKEPEILLLDEPTNNLDLKNQFQTMELLKHVSEKHGVTVVLSIHDINIACRYSDYLLLLDDGAVCGYDETPNIGIDSLSRLYDIKLERGTAAGSVFFVPSFETKEARDGEA
ncbi:MAG TPA: ABC transporter ATP-binding protein [bacterium]|nr:ABC transporter ATP-binding protein [bacterium]